MATWSQETVLACAAFPDRDFFPYYRLYCPPDGMLSSTVLPLISEPLTLDSRYQQTR